MQLSPAARTLGTHRVHRLLGMGMGHTMQGAGGVHHWCTAGLGHPWRTICAHARAVHCQCCPPIPLSQRPVPRCCHHHSSAAVPPQAMTPSPLLPSPLSPVSIRPPLVPHTATSPDKTTVLSPPTAASVSAAAAGAAAEAGGVLGDSSLSITRPDDWHLHLRDGAAMACVLPFSARVFRRAIIMPNLRPPVTSVEAALAYRGRILGALPEPLRESFEPLMTLYLTDATTPEDVRKAKASGVVHALKLYPAGATTNSDQGVTDLLGRCLPTLNYMADIGMPLLVHGEVVDPSVDFFDREAVFIEWVLGPLMERVPALRVVMEHITTADAAQFVLSFPEDRIAATVTPQHMLWNRNSLFVPGGIRPHNFCLPILKREKHREAVTRAATGGSRRFFLGTDSAPHERRTKEAACGCAGIFSAHAALPLYATIFEQAGALESLEAFASFNGPDFYRLPRNTDTVTLTKAPWGVPEAYPFGEGEGDSVVPMMAGEQLEWAVAESDIVTP